MAQATEQSQLDSALRALAGGRQRDPFAVLGPHVTEDGRAVVVRALHPAARSIDLRRVATGEFAPMQRRGDEGIFEVVLPGESIPDYRLRITYKSGQAAEIDDPYRYGRV